MEILGLLDTLESTILDSTKIPMTKKIIINEEQILELIDKILLVAQGGAGFAKEKIDKDRSKASVEREEPGQMSEQISMNEPITDKAKSAEIIQQAYQIAKEVREGADKYADEVLSNLELASTRVLRTIKAGRERLQKTVQGTKSQTDE